MQEKITPLPMPFTTNVTIDARAEDVHIRVDPALIFTSTVMPGEKIPEGDQEAGVALIVQKGSEVNVMTVLTDNKADQLVEALVTSIIRADKDREGRAGALLEKIQKAMISGIEFPAYPPHPMTGCIHHEDGDDNAPIESDEGRTED